MILHKIITFLVSVIIVLFSYSQTKIKNTLKPEINFVNVGNHTELEVLDWGGKGKPVLLLAGLGATAHIYTDFAPQFTNTFHVYGLTRRGFGKSSQPSSGYDINTLVHDIVTVIDSLHIKKVILIGHSFAGQEVTKFASSYPERVEKVVYLDAAYDWTSMLTLFGESPEYPSTEKDFSSMENDKLYLKKVTGVLFPDDEMRASFTFDKDGKYIDNVSPDSIGMAIVKGLERPNYTLVKSPALAIYVRNETVNDLFPLYSTFDTTNKRKANSHFIVSKKFTETGEGAFTKEVKHGKVAEIKGANHYIFISNPVETAKLTLEFLSSK